MSQVPIKYDARHIQVSEAWEAIRKRPGMYIGSTGERGLHQLVFEIAGRAVNEVLAGRGTRVEVALLPDGGVRVADDGPGVPFENAAGGRVSGLEAQLTHMNYVPLRGPRYPVLDFCGVGPFVANALSSRMVAEVQRDGVRRVQRYARGVAVDAPADAGPADGTATVISFWPDSDIFETTECSFDLLAGRFRELAFLNRGLDISLTDERGPAEPQSVRFSSLGGVREMLALLGGQGADTTFPDVVGFEREDPRMRGRMELALTWLSPGQGLVRSYANSRPTSGGGTHVAGLLEGVRAAVDAYARGLPSPVNADFAADRISEAVAAVVSVKLEQPEFAGAARAVLGNAAVRECVSEAVLDYVGRWLEEHPHQAAAVIGRVTQEIGRD